MSEPLIEFLNVTIFRGLKKALDRLTLSIGVGEHVAIIGPNGCGKSTLIHTITRDYYPWLGDGDASLRILGRDRWRVFDLRAHMGIITADLMRACTTNYPAREVVLSGFFSSVGIWPNHEVTPEMEAKADEVLELLEIGHLADRNVNEMSSGEARRAVIGRALVHDPQALILDEPSTSLDFRSTYELRDLLRKIARSGKSIILVTHHLPDIIPEMERVILMRQGKIFHDGPKEQVLNQAHLRELFGVDVDLIERDGYYNLW